MPKLPRERRLTLSRIRLRNVLAKHVIATARTLEQKISDAGPLNQRIDPHILTRARNGMVNDGELLKRRHVNLDWYFLAGTDESPLQDRLREQATTIQGLQRASFNQRMGQTLEIATYRALLTVEGATFFGRFKDLDQHGDDQMYKKEEPPQHLAGRELDGDERLDFLALAPSDNWLGIECKNLREWLYPDRLEVRETILKCLQLDVVPVIIARRIPYVTFRLLSSCGVIVHQTYNQLFPESDRQLADRARHKLNLGYHDIRVGNSPDARMLKFIGRNLLTVAASARSKFEAYKDLLSDFVYEDTSYGEFAARVRRREAGTNEDSDWEETGDPADWDEW